MLSKEEVEARVGFSIPNDYWEFNPWGNRILVKRVPKEEQTKGGLIIPNSSQALQTVGIVVKVGHTVGLIYGDVQTPGQVVIHPFFEGDMTQVQDALVGAKISFGMFSGTAMSEGTTGNEYDGDWILLQAIDILGHITT